MVGEVKPRKDKKRSRLQSPASEDQGVRDKGRKTGADADSASEGSGFVKQLRRVRRKRRGLDESDKEHVTKGRAASGKKAQSGSDTDVMESDSPDRRSASSDKEAGKEEVAKKKKKRKKKKVKDKDAEEKKAKTKKKAQLVTAEESREKRLKERNRDSDEDSDRDKSKKKRRK